MVEEETESGNFVDKIAEEAVNAGIS